MAGTYGIPRALWIALLLPALAFANGDTRAAILDETVAGLRRALADDNYVSVTNACARLESMRAEAGDEQLGACVRVLAKGLRHRDVSIAIVATRTLGNLGVAGSSRYLTALLSPPRRVEPGRWNLHLAAIEAAGRLHETASLSRLVGLLRHDTTDLAVAAAKALGAFVAADLETRIDVVRRMGVVLGRFEKAHPHSHLAKVHHAVVIEAVRDAIRTVAKLPALASADDAREWVRRARREAKNPANKAAGPTSASTPSSSTRSG